MKLRYFLVLTSVVILAELIAERTVAQISQGGVPLSFTYAMPVGTAAPVSVAPPQTDILLQEDAAASLPYRFGVNLPADFDISATGEWNTAPDGSTVWRLSVVSPGALALTLYFDRFRLPEGGKLFVYNPQRTELIGAFTHLNNNSLSTFATQLIHGDRLTLEYDAPAGTEKPQLHISEVAYAYRGISDYSGVKTGFKGSGICQVNMNCPEGDNWRKEQRSVTRIQVKRNGSNFWCTGSLVNNVRNDGTPYVLTADHCGRYATALDLSQWIFYFNYECPTCTTPTQEPSSNSITGSALVAHGGEGGTTGSDFFLVLLNSRIPFSYNAYFTGWSRDTVSPSPSGVGIHHPEGDIKKISTYNEKLAPANWAGHLAISHWLVYWIQTANGHGTTEGGSSGSPLFDNNGLLVGTLTGGQSGCDSNRLWLEDYYGQFAYHWESNGTDSLSVLKYWLDPDNKNVMSLNGWSVSVDENSPENWLTIYPNPASDHIIVKTGATGIPMLSVEVSDLWGKSLIRRSFDPGKEESSRVDLQGLARGMYLVRVSDGTREAIRKIILL